jgi:hypothetical protein
MTQERLPGRWLVRLLVLGRRSLPRGAREGELEGKGRGRGAVTGEVIEQVVLLFVGV